MPLMPLDISQLLVHARRSIAERARLAPSAARSLVAASASVGRGIVHWLDPRAPLCEIEREALQQEAMLRQVDDLSAAEQAAVHARLAEWDDEYRALHRLARHDIAIAGAAGVLAALADILLVKVPAHPGFLGSAGSEGGWLSNVMKDRFAHVLPPETVARLERAYSVPYDASVNAGLDEVVAGLSPRTHRLHSLGHDPLLGWVFGVRDILAGEFTAIDADGRIVVQSIDGTDPGEAAVTIFARLADALVRVGGHLASDVATTAGLPPPLFALLQSMQSEAFGGHSIADVSRAMYRAGYDFRHFLAGGVCVAMIEVIVRTSWLMRELADGKPLTEALPIGSKPRLRSTLLLAHGTAAVVNAGKVAITRNPLGLNYAQWLALMRYVIPQLRWLLVGHYGGRSAFLRERIDERWRCLDEELAAAWCRVSAAAATPQSRA